jgi:SAM-dependent methyltransferase
MSLMICASLFFLCRFFCPYHRKAAKVKGGQDRFLCSFLLLTTEGAVSIYLYMDKKKRKDEIVDKRLEAGNYRHEIAMQVPEGSTRIFEYGFGDGSLLLGLERDRGCREMYGVEVNPHAIAQMDGLLDGAWLIDLNKPDAWLEEEYENFFNYILAPMSLEHTYDPWYVLKKFNKYLAHGGKVILQVPNAQSWTCLYHVLTGDFPYVSGGTWDYTHIRWYTLKSLVDIAFVAGFKVEMYIPEIPNNVDIARLQEKREMHVLRLPPPELGEMDLKPIDIAMPYDIGETYPLFLATSLIVTLVKDRTPEDCAPTPRDCYLESYRLITPNPLAHNPPLIAHPIVPSGFQRSLEKAKRLHEKMGKS